MPDLIEMCGGETAAKVDFLKRLNEIIEEMPELVDHDNANMLALAAWRHGFNSCSKVIFGSLKREDMVIMVRMPNGEYHRFAPR